MVRKRWVTSESSGPLEVFPVARLPLTCIDETPIGSAANGPTPARRLMIGWAPVHPM